MLDVKDIKIGQNILSKPASEKWYNILWDKYKDPIIKILIVACIFNLIINLYTGMPLWETCGILAAILITTVVAWWQDMKSKQQFDALSEISDKEMVTVHRLQDNEVITVEIEKDDLCIGDEVILKAGDEVYADIKIIKNYNIKCNESNLTGESKPVDKNAENSILYRSSIITEGTGIGEVIEVGDNTKIGKTIRHAYEITNDKTPLTLQLEKLADKITNISYFIALFLLISFNINYFFFTDNIIYEWPAILSNELNFLMIAVVIIIAAVPEGLALSVVLALTYSVKAMMKDNNLVKKMKATETLGAVDIIFTDKTGTLTKNDMSVNDVLIVNNDNFIDNAVINNSAEINNKKQIIGNSTDCAILKYIIEHNIISQKAKTAEIKDIIPFDSNKKYMSTILDDGTIYIKGAPEIIANIIGDNEFLSDIKAYQKRGYRVIAFASKINGIYTYDGSVCIYDPIRPDVPDAIKQCYKAGINVIMMTGDNILTATEIAKDAGFNNIKAVNAREFPKELSLDSYPNVIARCLPEDKLRIMKQFQDIGYVCAMTGDGVNDTPALNHANIGISMGNGSVAAKEVSDIVLLDNAFPSIAKGIKWGRSLYKNIQSFLSFQLTVNLALCLTACFGVFLGCSTPFNVIQILYINLVMDALGALALASEPAINNIMKDTPRDKDEFIITGDMMKFIIANGGILFLIMMILILIGYTHLLFPVFMLICICNLFKCRVYNKELSIIKSLGRNKLFIYVVLGITIMNILLIQVFGGILNIAGLTLNQWILSTIISICNIIISDKLYKLFKVF